MVATLYDIYQQFLRHVIAKRNIILFTSRDCCWKCAHCVQSQQGHTPASLMPKETIDKAFSQLWEDNGFSICICGGEAMLHPDQVAYVVKKAKERNLPTILGTNGFWWHNKDFLHKLKYEIKPTFIRLSVDIFHQKFMPFEEIKQLIHYFDDSEIKIFGGTIWRYECSDEDREAFDSLGVIYESMACVMHGNAGALKRTEELPCGSLVQCEACGIVVLPNGDLYMECELEAGGCKVGNIYDANVSFKSIIENINKYTRPWYEVKEHGIHDIYDICRKNNDFIFDEKWNLTAKPKDIEEKKAMTNIYITSVKEDNDYFKEVFTCLEPLKN